MRGNLLRIFLVCIAAPHMLFAASEERRLKASDAFYKPYRNEFFLVAGVGHTQQKLKAELSSLGITSEFTAQSVTAVTGASFGILDRLGVAVTGRFLLDESSKIVNTGSTSSGSQLASRSGAYAPAFNVYARLAGVNRNQWYVDFSSDFTPGIKSSDANRVVNPQSNIVSGISVGKNHGGFTAGLGFSFDYTMPTEVNKVNYREFSAVHADAVVQYDFGSVFTRLRVLVMQYVDSQSSNDPILKELRTNLQFETGFNLTNNAFLTVNFLYRVPMKTTVSLGSISYSYTDGPTIGGAMAFGVRF